MSTDPHQRRAAGEGPSQAAAEEAVRRFLAGDATARALGITVGDVAPGTVTADGRLLAEMRGHSRVVGSGH